jgi:hypothetical protein
MSCRFEFDWDSMGSVFLNGGGGNDNAFWSEKVPRFLFGGCGSEADCDQ